MREIKFRAWDEKRQTLWSAESIAWGCDERGYYAVSKFGHGRLNNVGFEQFTGLKDRNGVEIYEGDIVRNPDCFGCVSSWGDAADESPELRTVIFLEREARFALEFMADAIKDRGVSGYTFCKANERLFEVIGNIHETPELLEAP